jgi:hypothetical protein
LEPIGFEDFLERTGIVPKNIPNLGHNTQLVVGLRDLVSIDQLLIMPRDYLATLLRRMPLLGEPNVFPYAKAEFSSIRMDPRGMLVAQTFVERKKCLNLLENFNSKLTRFLITNGVAKCTAFIAYGQTKLGNLAVAHYIPPLVELHDSHILLDGTHRDYLVMTIGTTLEVIVISGVSQPFPCTPVPWNMVRPVDEKPAKEDRNINLKPELFRDLKYVGIDG